MPKSAQDPVHQLVHQLLRRQHGGFEHQHDVVVVVVVVANIELVLHYY